MFEYNFSLTKILVKKNLKLKKVAYKLTAVLKHPLFPHFSKIIYNTVNTPIKVKDDSKTEKYLQWKAEAPNP